MHIFYGRHFPEGECAVNHIYGPLGTWKPLPAGTLKYVWNYYHNWATAAHPFNPGELISFANGKNCTTCRDANGYVLGDLDGDGEVDPGFGGAAFHEHNGVAGNGVQAGTPFTQFWFDDNFCAKHMTEAWGKPEPSGLPDENSFVRWRQVIP